MTRSASQSDSFSSSTRSGLGRWGAGTTSTMTLPVKMLQRVRTALRTVVAAVHCDRFAPTATDIKADNSSIAMAARVFRPPRRIVTTRPVGSGSDLRHSETRTRTVAATRGTKNIVNERTVSYGSLTHGAWK